ncbi:WD40 repeat-like protein [Fistulina hepatica ATCC 64428]|nr:WD40 repeat-like protein [Fistulina hepatica ATCC 64428]
MLAVLCTDVLCVADSSTLKRPPPALSSKHVFATRPTASAWSPDNDNLFIASNSSILKYSIASETLSEVYTADADISCLCVKDKTTVIFSVSSKIYILEGVLTNPRVSTTLETHKSGITSLSLSNDATLLVSASATAIHIHNLVSGSHSSLRGLVAYIGKGRRYCSFHRRSRTRLIVAVGKNVLIYDSTRSSSPLKSITLGDDTEGNVNAVSCSPFSKTLVAVSTDGGSVGLIDWEKDKPLFRTINLKVPISCMTFSPEGAAVQLGTENGNLLILDLRALDKTPRSILVSEKRERVETLSVQSLARSQISRPVAASARAISKNMAEDAPPPGSRSKKSATAAATLAKKTSPTVSARSISAGQPVGPAALSPVHVGSLLSRPLSPSLSQSSTPCPVEEEGHPAESSPDLPNTPITPLPNSKRRSCMKALGLGSPGVRRLTKARGVAPSGAKGKGKGKVVDFKENDAESSSDNDGAASDRDSTEAGDPVAEHQLQPEGFEHSSSMSLQLTPRLPSSFASASHVGANAWAPSPLRRSLGGQNPLQMPASPRGAALAQDFLRSIIKDVMYDFQAESRAEMTGLHLDLLRMGRSWKNEMHGLMEEYVGDLKELREENKRLREENERLRRGY